MSDVPPARDAQREHSLTPYEAALRLGAVYAALERRGELPAEGWIVPGGGAESRLLPAISTARPALASKRAMLEYYEQGYRVLREPLETEARAWAASTVEGQELLLGSLALELKQPGRAHELQTVARAVEARARQMAKTAPPAPAAGRRETVSQLIERLTRHRLASALAPETDRLMKTLFAHPDGPWLLGLFAAAPEAGRSAALERLDESRAAALEFRRLLISEPESIWRFPPAVVGGVGRLGLLDVHGFPHYAVALAGLLVDDTADDVVDALGMVLLCAGLLFSGPLAVLVITGLDLALSAASTALAYMRDREQDVAATATAFRPAADRLAEKPSYANTALAGAASLVTAAGLLATPGARKLLARESRAVHQIPVPAPKAPPAVALKPPKEVPDSVVGNPGVSARGLDEPGTATKNLAADTRTAAVHVVSPAPSATPLVHNRGTSGRHTAAPASAGAVLQRPNRPHRPARVDTRFAGTIMEDTAATGGITAQYFDDATGAYVVEGRVQPGRLVRRRDGALGPGQRWAPEFNQKLGSKVGSGAEHGLEGYEWAHAFPIRWGDETAVGMMLAPGEAMNRALQSFGPYGGLEGFIGELATLLQKRGGTIDVAVHATKYPNPTPRGFVTTSGVEILKEITYRFDVLDGQGGRLRAELTLAVSEPPNGVGTVIDDFGLAELLALPDRLVSR